MERYEVFMDEVKPQDLSLTFLREFMSLPKSYFNAGAPIKCRKLNKLCLIDINFNLHLLFSLLCDVGPLPVKWVSEFKEWLQSIPQYPKAFKFQMNSMTELVNFSANDLFPDEVC